MDDAARVAIADALGVMRDRTVVEIGPGHGAITAILAQRCKRLIAVEVDPSLAAELRFQFRDHGSVEIVEENILETDLGELVGGSDVDGVDVIGNLPYYITSDILLHLFAAARRGMLRRAVLMMQREVAERVCATPGSREYGLLSATAQMHGRVETLFTLPPGAFSPPPEVFSTVVRMEFAPRFVELGVDPAGFDAFLKVCFAQKCKTLFNNLRAAGYLPVQIVESWPEAIARDVRAESVSLEAAAGLFHNLAAGMAIGGGVPE